MPVVASARHRHRQAREGVPFRGPDRDAERHHAALGTALVEHETVAPYPGQFGPQPFQVGPVLGPVGVPLGRVDRLEFLAGQLGQQQQSRRDAVGREHHALAGAHPQALGALDAGDEPDRVPGAHRQVDGLLEHVDQPVQVRQGDVRSREAAEGEWAASSRTGPAR